ncbi:MAG: hypothetical protein PHI18_09360, partial [bacterium]|nr:hypothetical protein [bacterium]
MHIFPEINQTSCDGIVQLSDGDFLCSGAQTRDEPYEQLIYLMRLDSMGSILWRQTYDFGIAATFSAYMCPLGSDRVAILNVVYEGDLFLLIADTAGNILQQETYARPSEQIPENIYATRDGGLFILYHDLDHEALLVRIMWMKTDGEGNVLWENRANLSERYLRADAANETPDGGEIITGFRSPHGTGFKALLIRVDAEGEVVFEREYQINDYTSGADALALADGGYLMCGRILVGENPNYHHLPFVYRLNAAGDSVWCWVGSMDDYLDELINHGEQLSDGGFLLHASTGGYSSLIHMTDLGEVLWQRRYL